MTTTLEITENPAPFRPLPEITPKQQINPRLYNWHRTAPLKPVQPYPRADGYIPALAERLDRDPNLTDGARRCARLIAAYTYRRNREGRIAAITVTYLTKALGRCRRTVQRYLRQLERFGYISVSVVLGQKSRMCAGLLIALLKPLLPRHQWPSKAAKSDATQLPQNYRLKIKIDREAWTERCREGTFRALCRMLSPAPDFLSA